MTLFQIGDIIDSVFWQGRGHPGEGRIKTGPYRIISRDLAEPEPHFLAQINHVRNPWLPPPNWCFVVVPSHIPAGQERKTDHCFLSHYLPTPHPLIMRSVWLGDGDYLIKRGSSAGAQMELI